MACRPFSGVDFPKPGCGFVNLAFIFRLPILEAFVWNLRQPAGQCLQRFLHRQSCATFSYQHVGDTTKNIWPTGFDHDKNRIRLGTGSEIFDMACDALRHWRQFPAPWTRIFPVAAPLMVGTNIAMIARAFQIWWINACRIVYVVDETNAASEGCIRRFGFAYGTLPEHVEFGEERFLIEQLADGSVWYDLRAFSRPRLWCVRLAYPLARRLQRRFVRDSQQAMQAAVEYSLNPKL
jgi:uncharacterized protein (UPF0548 family)